MNNDNKDTPMTQGQFQTLHNLMRTVNGKLDTLQEDMTQLKRDVNTIAKNTGHYRDMKTGQLRKTA